MTSSTAVLMIRNVMLLLGLVTTLQDLSPGSRSCLLSLEQVRGHLGTWTVTLVMFVLIPTLAVRTLMETGAAVLCLRYSISNLAWVTKWENTHSVFNFEFYHSWWYPSVPLSQWYSSSAQQHLFEKPNCCRPIFRQLPYSLKVWGW